MSTAKQGYRVFPCDLCGSNDAVEIDYARHYTHGQPIHVCRSCGLVYVRERRDARAIADEWSNLLYVPSGGSGPHYTARRPAVLARLTFVAAFIANAISSHGKTLCDIGAGEGEFLKMMASRGFGADVFGIEPSSTNCGFLTDAGIANFEGTVEDFVASTGLGMKRFDIVTIMWTLECCQDAGSMLDAAHAMLNDGGHVVIATGSRILVPFKKPLQYYLGPQPADLYPIRYSANTLTAHLAAHGFRVHHVNRYIDSDVLCVAARKVAKKSAEISSKDDYRAVIDFFRRWHEDTKNHYRDA